jgi:glycolate dehydrogenase iron-sulfur subunit
MQTAFSLAQLADSNIETVNGILRACVHCGFCTATCPTYVLLGDELDSPRGRIYQMKSFLEEDRVPTREEVTHIDRCLSCLSCMTTCPASVNYMHLVDHGRAHIEMHYQRPWRDRVFRWALSRLLPYPRRFRLAMVGASLAKFLSRPMRGLLPKRIGSLLGLVPKLSGPSWMDRPQTHSADGERRARVALLTGCAQTVLAPQINEATIRLLTRLGIEVVVAKGAGCCGSLAHHMGRTTDSHAAAGANITAWTAELDGKGLDAILVNTSGCGTTIKDYGFMFREDAALAEPAARISNLTKDITEFLSALGAFDTPISDFERPNIAYHSACSMQHGQGIKSAPVALLEGAGFTVREPAESHLCCGSAGTYNILQPTLATQLRDRKLANIAQTEPQVIATGNIGCMMQLASGTDLPVVHTVELLDWATGGPKPDGLE